MSEPRLGFWLRLRQRLRHPHVRVQPLNAAVAEARDEGIHRESRGGPEPGTGVTVTPGAESTGLPGIIA